MMKRAAALVLAAGLAVGSYATDARVAVMGRQPVPWFYRDEVSVFTNPADMSLYPNMIYGSFGWVDKEATSDAWMYKNSLPNDPFFGALFSHRLSEEDNGPMFSVGAFANRRDYTLERLLKAGGTNLQGDNNLLDPVGKIDLMLGYDFGNGLALGLGSYIAIQNKKKYDNVTDRTEFYKGTLGLNYNIEQGLDLEGAVNFGFTTAGYTDTLLSKYNLVSDNEYFLRGDVRFFTAVPAINGSFVPQVSLEYLKLANKDIMDLNGGVGLNMNIDRGFFWAGLQGVYTHTNDMSGDPGSSDQESIGARLSFGIERNIVWDWFLIRVGGQKEIRYVKSGSETNWAENHPADGSDNDLVGLGFGVNIDNRLRIDFVVSESLPYTFTNLISGAQHHLFNRVSATYRF